MYHGEEGQVRYLLACQIDRPGHPADGAMAFNPEQMLVNPYFANFAAKALILQPENHQRVRRYLDWYLRHMEPRATIYDRLYLPNGKERKHAPDSEDAYAATFLSLVADYYYATEDRKWVETNLVSLDLIGRLIINLTMKDGLTIAKRSFKVKYLADNCECFKGLRDYATLLEEIYPEKASFYHDKARALRLSIETELWDSTQGWYYVVKRPLGRRHTPVFSRWYPDAAALLYPTVCGVISPTSLRATNLFYLFNSSQPGWTHFETGDPYPWMLAGYYAGIHGDFQKAREQLRNADHMYIERNSPYWYNMEAAHYLLTVSLIKQLTGHA